MHARPFEKAAWWCAALLLCAWLTGCATTQAPARDHSAFLAANPASILVLPPINESPEVQASDSVLSHATRPLAEAGYYVMPVTLVKETLRHNGMEIPEEIHAIPEARLRKIFGADTALYIRIQRYGTVYQVFDSVTRVSAEARLVDLRSSTLLWSGSASASNKEGGDTASSSLTNMLITALVNQVIQTATDASHDIAGIAAARLLAPGGANGLRHGPHSPLHGRN